MILISSREDAFDTNHGIGLILDRLETEVNFEVAQSRLLRPVDSFYSFFKVLLYFVVGIFRKGESYKTAILIDDWRLIGGIRVSQLRSLRLLHIDSRYRYSLNRYLRNKEIYTLLKVLFYLVFETIMFKTIKTVLVSSEDIRPFSRPDMATVIPNGVMPPTSDVKIDGELRSATFYGNMIYAENRECANFTDTFISPILNKYNIPLTLAGANSHVLQPRNSVIYGRFDDITSFLAEHDILMSYLLSGAGIKNKVLEAMSHGLIVIGTSYSFDGINEAVSWKNCIRVTDFIELEIALDRLAKMTSTEIVEMRSQSVEVAAKYSWEQTINKYIEFFG